MTEQYSDVLSYEQLIEYFGAWIDTQQQAQPITTGVHGNKQQEMSTGGRGISLDRDSVSKELQSRIVPGFVS